MQTNLSDEDAEAIRNAVPSDRTLVKRLRRLLGFDFREGLSPDLAAEAADRIESLEQRVKVLTDACKLAAPHGSKLQHGENVSISAEAYEAICAALADKEQP